MLIHVFALFRPSVTRRVLAPSSAFLPFDCSLAAVPAVYIYECSPHPRATGLSPLLLVLSVPPPPPRIWPLHLCGFGCFYASKQDCGESFARDALDISIPSPLNGVRDEDAHQFQRRTRHCSTDKYGVNAEREHYSSPTQRTLSTKRLIHSGKEVTDRPAPGLRCEIVNHVSASKQ